mgnify:CR=1 FL=1
METRARIFLFEPNEDVTQDFQENSVFFQQETRDC